MSRTPLIRSEEDWQHSHSDDPEEHPRHKHHNLMEGMEKIGEKLHEVGEKLHEVGEKI